MISPEKEGKGGLTMPHTVLVAEDDQHINEVVTEYMKDAGHIALSFDNGSAALHALTQSGDIDMFILDIMLPGLSGLELLRAIRASEAHRDKPVIMLTALGDEAMQVLSFEALADDYVVKPFSPKVLVKRVETLFRRCGGEKKLLQYGQLTLDYDRFEAYDSGEKIQLTLREFELLGALMNHAGKVLNRQQLLNQAWGYDYFGDERIVDVHIKNLRKKLVSDIITTVKGVGYKLGGGA
jgi:DNA-binding response OmpR family regulator